MSEQLAELLRSETKGMEDATGVLSRLIRKTWHDLNINKLNTWQNKVNRYMAVAFKDVPEDDVSKRSSFKGNLDKALVKPEMTWDVFLTTVRVLGAKRSILVFTLHYPEKEPKEFLIDLRRANSRTLMDTFNAIVTYYGIKLNRWNDLVTEYIERKAIVRPGDTKRLWWLRGNIGTKIREENLSIRNFTTILAILNPTSVSIKMELTWPSGNTTIHRITFASRDTFGEPDPEKEDETT